MSREAEVRAAFATQADWCRRLDSPFMARLCEQLPDSIDPAAPLGRRLFGWAGDPVADALALRLTGGLHALVRRGRLPRLAAHYPPRGADDGFAPALAAALRDADAELQPWLDTAPQTNEVGRSAVLMAGLLVVAAETRRPLRLFELGASAGLNLRLDHYRYRLGTRRVARAGAGVELAPDWTGDAPPDARIEVAERRGVDLAPLDVCDPATRERLLAYVWPDQPQRLERLAAALAAAAADPPPIDRGDAAGWIEQRVAPVAGSTAVVLHSIAFQYFPAASQQRIAAHMARAGAAATVAAPLAWLRFEFDPAEGANLLRLRLWPGGEDRRLARAHPHGSWIDWLA